MSKHTNQENAVELLRGIGLSARVETLIICQGLVDSQQKS